MAEAAVQPSKVGKVNLLENKPHDSQKKHENGETK